MAYPILAYVHLFSFPVPAVVGIAKYARLQRAMKTLTILSIFACIDVGTQYVLASFKVKNYFVSDYFRVIEVGLLSMVFQMLSGERRVRTILRWMGGVFIAVWIVDMVVEVPAQINNAMEMISRIFILVMSLISLQASMKDESSPLVERSVFWVGLGAALYSSGTMVLVGLSNYLMQLGNSYFLAAWHINWALLIVANLFYTKGMLCKYQG